MRIAFLGGTRFIGLQSVLEAIERGHQVTVLHRGIHRSKLPPEVREIIVDRENGDDLRAILSNLDGVDVLVDTFSMNREQTNKVIVAIKGLISKVIVLSSQDVYAQFGALNGHPAPMIETRVTESSPLTVKYPFRGIADHAGGETYDKKDVEEIYVSNINKSLEAVTIIRLPAVFGLNDYQRRFSEVIDFIDQGNRKIPCQNNANWRWSMIHVKNAAHAIILAAEKIGMGVQVFNVADEPILTMRERVEKIARAMNVSIDWAEVESLPDNLGHLGKMPNDFVVDSSKVRSILGYSEIYSDDQSYADLVSWIRKSRVTSNV